MITNASSWLVSKILGTEHHSLSSISPKCYWQSLTPPTMSLLSPNGTFPAPVSAPAASTTSDATNESPPIFQVGLMIAYATHSSACGKLPPTHSLRKFRSRNHCRCSINDCLSRTTPIFKIQIGGRGMFLISLADWRLSRDIADSNAPIMIKPSPLQTSRRHFGIIHSFRPHPAFHASMVESTRIRSKISGGIGTIVNYPKVNQITEIPQVAIPCVVQVPKICRSDLVSTAFGLFSGLP